MQARFTEWFREGGEQKTLNTPLIVLFLTHRLNTTYRQLQKDNENLQLDHKNIKTQLNGAKLEQTRLEAEFSKLKEQYQQLDITSTKLTNQCEVRAESTTTKSSRDEGGTTTQRDI